jgi:uncharacterized protein (TIGR02145 family)
MKKLLLPLLLFGFNILAQIPGAGVTDIDGNQYPSVIIGTQEWMAENLRTTSYANGDPIPNVTDDTQWYYLTTGAWVHYNNDSQYENPYGKLYNWHTVNDSRNVCPVGWHVPSDAEWTVLSDYLGGATVAGGKMKSIGTQYWQSPNTDATNESGFSGLPGGSYHYYGGFSFIEIGKEGCWWSSTESGPTIALYRSLFYASDNVSSYADGKLNGFSIRCLKGAPLGIIELTPVKKELLKIVDLLGRETEFKPNTVLIYVYSDGSTERIFKTE